jgi:hypothetical protein
MILKRTFRFLFDCARLAYGGVGYLLTGKTPSQGYQGMIGLFCATRGVSNDLLARMVGRARGRAKLASTQGLLGDMAGEKLERTKSQLEREGYAVFERILPQAAVDRLREFALTTRGRFRGSAPAAPGGLEAHAAYDRSNPLGVRYDFDPEDVINNGDVQALMADASILSLAQAYLGSRPVADVTSMWWHTAFSREPDSDAAQFYHFDMDRIRWLKFFFYLTDVGPHSGPHCFISGSHRTRSMPRQLLDKGYARITDEEASRFFESGRMREFHAPAGTLIVEDTRGLHKGKVVERGDRLMLQLQFSNSLFGARYPRVRFNSMIPALAGAADLAPGIYDNYLPR